MGGLVEAVQRSERISAFASSERKTGRESQRETESRERERERRSEWWGS